MSAADEAFKPFTRVQCIGLKCGIYFEVPRHVYDQARANKDRFIICPGCGTSFHYSRNEADELREKVARLEREIVGEREETASASRRADRNWRTAIYWKGIAHRRRRP